MKAIVNIGTREVTINYSIDNKSLNIIPFEERKHNWEMFQKTLNLKKIQCKQSFTFKECDEWISVRLLDGRMIDFHYDYEERSQFNSKKDWGSYIFQGYEYNGEPQLYDKQISISVKIDF